MLTQDEVTDLRACHMLEIKTYLTDKQAQLSFICPYRRTPISRCQWNTGIFGVSQISIMGANYVYSIRSVRQV